MVDRDDLAFFAKAMTPSKATTEAGWDRLCSAIEAADAPLPVEASTVAAAPKLAIWASASLLAAAVVGVVAFGVDRDRWAAEAEHEESAQAVHEREEPVQAPKAAPSRGVERTPPPAIEAAPPAVELESTPVPRRSKPRRPAGVSPRPPIAEPLPQESPPIAAPEAPRVAEVQADVLAREAASLRRVERSIASGDLGRARSLLRAHRREFANGVLAREASLLQVVVACESEDVDAAASAAHDHAIAFPADPTTARLRRQVCSK
jgi:hypothetical protein